MDLDDRQRRALLMAALILGSVGAGAVVVYATSHLSNTVSVSDGVTIGAPNGLNVEITETADVNLTDPWPDSSTVEIVSSVGNVTVSGPGGANVTIDQINGTWTNTSSLDVAGNEVEIDPGDKPAFNVTGDADTLDVRTGMAPDDDTVDFVYSGTSGTTTVTLRGLPATTEMAAVDRDTNEVLAVATSSAGGTVTFSGMPNSEHTVELLTTKGEPIIASTSPPDNQGLSQSQVTLEAEIKDPDFPNDNVTVEFYLDGSLEDTQHIKSNQTVSTTAQVNTGGDHTWHVETTDAYGATNNSATFTVSTPSELNIRLETNPDQLATGVQVTVTSYYSGSVQTRNVTDGTMSLTGFPIDEPIIVRTNATNFTRRTAVIESIFEQQSIYILNDSVATYLVRFDLRDPTGSYPTSDTVLFVERDLNQSSSTEWRIIAGDNFGVQGIPVHLKQDERYRLRIKNLETDQSAVIGAYTAIQSETVTIEAGSASIDAPTANRTYHWSISENESGQYILFEYNDTAGETDSIKLNVHERFNESNVLISNQTFTNTNNLVYQIPMTADEANKTWTAELYVDRGGGYQHYRIPISGGPTNIIPDILDTVWITGVGVFVLLITGMAFSELNQTVGGVATSIVGGLLWWVGLLEGVTVGAAVVLAIAVSAVVHFRREGGV